MSLNTATVEEDNQHRFTVVVRDIGKREMLCIGYGTSKRNAESAARAINRGLWIVGNVIAKMRSSVFKETKP